MQRQRVLILGAAGRDFHNFNVVFRGRPDFDVVAFTAQQIPHIDERTYPPSLAGPLYPDGIPIQPEDRLEELIRHHRIDVCILAYSDLSHEEVMHLASRAGAAGADFQIFAPGRTMLRASRPVVAVCASRTGAGKSQTSRVVVSMLRDAGLRVAVLRHPMPYGDLARQRLQRFASLADLAEHDVTIEEREEYEPHIAAGSVVFAGVDYEAILNAAQKEADVLLWDGGNNDTSFLAADLYITVVDPHRPGHELRYHPGETNTRIADLIIINKVDSAKPDDVATVERNCRAINPRARIVHAASPVTADAPERLRGRQVLAIEDGPTLTHGGMGFGAATLGARAAGAAAIVDPRPFAVGEIAATFSRYPSLGPLLPAMGYGTSQINDLERTIAAAARHGVEAVAIGTPIDLASLIRIDLPVSRVRYDLDLRGDSTLAELLAPIIDAAAQS
jgi:predicted GTPase